MVRPLSKRYVESGSFGHEDQSNLCKGAEEPVHHHAP